jgi:hypothetical protein
MIIAYDYQWNLIWVCVLLYPVLSLSRAGFEPALPKETELKSVALDHSANETFVFFDRQYYYGALTTKLTGGQRHPVWDSNPRHRLKMLWCLLLIVFKISPTGNRTLAARVKSANPNH